MILLAHGGSPDVPHDVEIAARSAIHPATHGRRGPAARARRDQHHQQRLPGHGPDRRDHPPDLAAGARDEALAADRGRAGLAGDGAAAGAGRRRRQRARAPATWPSTRPSRPGCTGSSGEVGSLRPGRLADIVLWRPAYFGVRPELVLKGGWFAWGAVRRGQRHGRGRRAAPLRPALGRARARPPPTLSATFVSAAADAAGLGKRLGSRRRLVPVQGTRQVTSGQPAGQHDGPAGGGGPAPTARSACDGRTLRADPVTEVPLSRRYLLG